MIDFYTDFPPTVNSYYVKTKRGIFISKKGREFRKRVAKDINEQLGAIEGLTQRIALTVILTPPDKRIRDVDNYMKALLDAITHSGLWEDDSLVDQLFIYRAKLGDNSPRGTFIRIEEASPVFTRDNLLKYID